MSTPKSRLTVQGSLSHMDLPEASWQVDLSGQSTASGSIMSEMTNASMESKISMSSNTSDPTFHLLSTSLTPPSRSPTGDDPRSSKQQPKDRREELRSSPHRTSSSRKARDSFRHESGSSAKRSPPRQRTKRSGEKRSGSKKKQIDTGLCVVVGDSGTSSMRALKLPTVLVKMKDRKFCKAMVHYVVLVPTETRHVNIPGVLMSHPSNPKGRRTTNHAELLPLLTTGGMKTACSPLLLHKKFKKMFHEGASFQLRVLAFGRPFEQWNASLESVNTLRAQVIKDIKHFPMENILPKKSSSRTAKKPKASSLKQTSARPSAKRTTATAATAATKKLSDYLPNLRIRGLSAAGGHRDFASWFSSLPPDIKIDNNFQCDTGVLKKDTFRDFGVLDKYLGISEVV